MDPRARRASIGSLWISPPHSPMVLAEMLSRLLRSGSVINQSMTTQIWPARSLVASLIWTSVLSLASCAITASPTVDPADAVFDSAVLLPDRSSEWSELPDLSSDMRAAVVDLGVPSQDVGGGDRGTAVPTDGTRPLCFGAPCSESEVCCWVQRRCVDRTRLTVECETPPDPNGDTACATNLQCAAGQICRFGDSVCGGAGRCSPREACRSPCGGCQVCGCDGVTRTVEEQCLLGVPGAASRACGSVPDAGADASGDFIPIGCGSDRQCPTGQRCCALTANCYAETCVGCCQDPPAGTRYPCGENAHCRAYEYCALDRCTSAGGCARRPPFGSCSGVVTLVCGCDGRTYVNECFARQAGVSVASTGTCP